MLREPDANVWCQILLADITCSEVLNILSKVKWPTIKMYSVQKILLISFLCIQSKYNVIIGVINRNILQPLLTFRWIANKHVKQTSCTPNYNVVWKLLKLKESMNLISTNIKSLTAFYKTCITINDWNHLPFQIYKIKQYLAICW